MMHQHKTKSPAYETYLSTQRYQTQTYPRIPCPHANSRWPCSIKRPPRQRSCSVKRLIFLTSSGATLPNTHRLRRPADFTATRSGGEKTRSQYFIVFAVANARTHARLGLAISRKVSPKAVVRNRIKRQVRESFSVASTRLNGPRHSGCRT